eukprot:CAMPEP_0171002372 /NCGR_PEP_ID=MMETSP0736-20130129/16145_1 /TAXON_ID=186038 /ORGANISM="Fragilariopsis kerguelensis, Strain L26-C5" /LENGTH=45 /DNA_ID= /DNA_START= /DNA_END= /DNA_ORIENTATION=
MQNEDHTDIMDELKAMVGPGHEVTDDDIADATTASKLYLQWMKQG